MTERADLVFPANDPVFPGHFRGRPIVPGALLLNEALAVAHARGLPPISEIQVVKFHRTLLPDVPCSVACRERSPGVFALECRSNDGVLLTAVLLTGSQLPHAATARSQLNFSNFRRPRERGGPESRTNRGFPLPRE